MSDHSVLAPRPGGHGGGAVARPPQSDLLQGTAKTRLDGKTAGGRAEAGPRVGFGDIAGGPGAEAAAAIRSKGRGADFIRLDVTDLDSIEAFKQKAHAARPQIDIVVTGAGLGGG